MLEETDCCKYLVIHIYVNKIEKCSIIIVRKRSDMLMKFYSNFQFQSQREQHISESRKHNSAMPFFG